MNRRKVFKGLAAAAAATFAPRLRAEQKADEWEWEQQYDDDGILGYPWSVACGDFERETRYDETLCCTIVDYTIGDDFHMRHLKPGKYYIDHPDALLKLDIVAVLACQRAEQRSSS